MASQHKAQSAKQTKEATQKRRMVRPIHQVPVLLTQQADLSVLQRAVANPGLAAPGDILALRRGYGNRAGTRLIQTKLTVGPVGDRYEREADRVAAQVMSIPAPATGQRDRRTGQQGRVVRFRDGAIIGLAERRRE